MMRGFSTARIKLKVPAEALVFVGPQASMTRSMGYISVGQIGALSLALGLNVLSPVPVLDPLFALGASILTIAVPALQILSTRNSVQEIRLLPGGDRVRIAVQDYFARPKWLKETYPVESFFVPGNVHARLQNPKSKLRSIPMKLAGRSYYMVLDVKGDFVQDAEIFKHVFKFDRALLPGR
jgi:hypothetical protein